MKKESVTPKTTVESVVPNADVAETPKVVICEVCGHGNPTNVGLCQMCSSYLYDLEVVQDGKSYYLEVIKDGSK